MKKISKGKKMMKEDPWIRSENHRELTSVLQLSEGAPVILPLAVQIAESDTADTRYRDSAALHSILGLIYHSLPDELSTGLKLDIEKVNYSEFRFALNSERPESLASVV